MTTITIDNIKLSNNKFSDFSALVEDFVSSNYTDSNIQNEYEVASDMKNSSLPESFIKNFIKSYE
jgi:hypothetical protein